MKSVSALALCVSLGLLSACGAANGSDQIAVVDYGRTTVTPPQASDSYYVSAHSAVKARVEARNPAKAKNVIIFVGDGMGISTITSGRIYSGQKKGLDGESYRLAMDKMPHLALSKTYAHDGQVSDSASTATAMLAGVKANVRTLGVTQDVGFNNCAAQAGNEVVSLLELAEDQGLATGIISTARITHATPASTYANAASRNWEDDSDLKGAEEAGCTDIASQLIDWPHGDGFEIALGGGRRNFMPGNMNDVELENRTGRRDDDRDLTAEWTAKSDDHVYVTDRAGFEAVDYAGSKRVLGLFEPSHMQYELDRAGDIAGEPSISEMTRAAITRVSQDEDGYVLLIEGGRIDHAHHGGNAIRALEDTVAFDEAVETALEMTSSDDTLIIVTADHSHTLTIAGYQKRNNPILGLAEVGVGTTLKGIDGKPYTTLGYINGPGAFCKAAGDKADCARPDLSDVDTSASDFRQQAAVPSGSETHAGEDVAIMASGPGSELVSGVMEQHEIFHVMAMSMGLTE